MKANVLPYWIKVALLFITWIQKFHGISSAYSVSHGGGSLVAKSWPTLCDHRDCSPPGSSVHGISQARILESVATSFSICESYKIPKPMQIQKEKV